MRVGDRSVTDPSNEADDEHVDQPRLHLSPRTIPTSDTTTSSKVAQAISQRRFLTTSQAIGLTSAVILIAILALQLLIDSPHQLPTLQLKPPGTTQDVSRSSKLEQDSKPSTREPIIRVNVTPGGVDSFRIEIRGKYQAVSLETGRTIALKLTTGEHQVTGHHAGLQVGDASYSTTQIEISPEQSPAILINGHLYRGKIRLFRRTDGKVSAVNVLPIEEYLASVVDSEMPAKFPEAARRAQAIVARTYALYQIQTAEPKAVFDLLSSQRSQKYLGVEFRDRTGRRIAGESTSSRQNVASTRGIVCRHQGQLFCTYYSAVCGGCTTDGRSLFRDASDVHRSVRCEWCRSSPHFRWKSRLSADLFQTKGLKQSHPSPVFSVDPIASSVEGDISRFHVQIGNTQLKVNGTELRERLPVGTLASPHFEIQLEDQSVIFEGRGHGHGVGFCQWGAKGMAEADYDCDAILRHYYPGVEIESIRY